MTEYAELAAAADRLFDDADDDDELLADGLSGLSPELRAELLDSDLLNAYQVFFFYFRVEPDEIVMDKLMLESASYVKYGIKINDYENAEMYFAAVNSVPYIVLTDGDEVIKRFSGPNAYVDAVEFAENGSFL